MTFETSIGDEWRAAWIRPRSSQPPGSVSTFTRTFILPGRPERGRTYATALGIYRLSLNGTTVSSLLAPGWTDYRKRVLYQTYDITPHLLEGENEVVLDLAPGWFAGHVGWFGESIYGSQPSVSVEIDVTLHDGRRIGLLTDRSWRCSMSTRHTADLLMGEHQTLNAASVRTLNGTIAEGHPEVKVEPQQHPPVRATSKVTPVSVERTSPNDWIIDLGEIISGWLRIEGKILGPALVKVEHAEALHSDMALYTENLRTAQQVDTYNVVAPGNTTLEPSFTTHGFRYARLSGPVELDNASVLGVSIHSDLERTGGFVSSDDELNHLHDNIVRSQLTNSVAVPTDCPQRDERLGWLGDMYAFTPTAAFNCDVNTFLRDWLRSVADGQAPDGSIPDVAPFHPERFSKQDDEGDALGFGASGWADAIVSVPWDLYIWYGDESTLEELWEPMLRWIQYLKKNSDNLIYTTPRYGDWLSDGPATPFDVLGTAYFARSTRTLAQVAAALGETRHLRELDELGGSIRDRFIAKFTRDSGWVAGDTQTSYVLSLAFGLLPMDRIQETVKRLIGKLREADWKRETGFIGTPHLLPTLADYGAISAAFQVLNRSEPPSWRSMVSSGATTMWERFDGWTQERGFVESTMNSLNHYTWGSVGQFLYQYVAGLRPDPRSPGFKAALFRPHPGGGLDWVDAWYESVSGRYGLSWQLEDDWFAMEVSVPPNTRATISLPWTGDFVCSGQGGRVSEVIDGRTLVGSGKWLIRATAPTWATQ